MGGGGGGVKADGLSVSVQILGKLYYYILDSHSEASEETSYQRHCCHQHYWTEQRLASLLYTHML